jgi:hypothetical protein
MLPLLTQVAIEGLDLTFAATALAWLLIATLCTGIFDDALAVDLLF